MGFEAAISAQYGYHGGGGQHQTAPIERLWMGRVRDHANSEKQAHCRLRGREDLSGETREVHYELYEDAQRYDGFGLKLAMPIVIVYGTRDESVEPASLQRWARGRSNVRLVPVDDGHQLTDSVDVIWQETAKAVALNT